MIQEVQLLNNLSERDTVSFTLEEIRPLVLANIDKAHDIQGHYALSKLFQYTYYHKQLKEFYVAHMPDKIKNLKMFDNLAYITLLSYTKRQIRDATSLEEFKIWAATKCIPDFKVIKEEPPLYEEGDGTYNCICSQTHISDIYVVTNKYTGIDMFVGSRCIYRSKIIDPEEFAIIKKQRAARKRYENALAADREKDRLEGRPQGFYEEERADKKRKRDDAIKERAAKKLARELAEEEERKAAEERAAKERVAAEERAAAAIQRKIDLKQIIICMDCKIEVSVKPDRIKYMKRCYPCHKKYEAATPKAKVHNDEPKVDMICITCQDEYEVYFSEKYKKECSHCYWSKRT